MGLKYGSLCNLCALALGLALRIFATVLKSPNKDKNSCCDPALWVLAMFVVSKRLSRSVSLLVCSFSQLARFDRKTSEISFHFRFSSGIPTGLLIQDRRVLATFEAKPHEIW